MPSESPSVSDMPTSMSSKSHSYQLDRQASPQLLQVCPRAPHHSLLRAHHMMEFVSTQFVRGLDTSSSYTHVYETHEYLLLPFSHFKHEDVNDEEPARVSSTSSQRKKPSTCRECQSSSSRKLEPSSRQVSSSAQLSGQPSQSPSFTGVPTSQPSESPKFSGQPTSQPSQSPSTAAQPTL